MEWVYWLIFAFFSVAFVICMIILDNRDSKNRRKPSIMRDDIDSIDCRLKQLKNEVDFLVEDIKQIKEDIYESSDPS